MQNWEIACIFQGTELTEHIFFSKVDPTVESLQSQETHCSFWAE